jgi:transcriptional regulator with XRE-family HTH domain
MDIEIKNIDFNADSTIKLESRKETKRWSKFSNQFIPVVEKISKNKYKLVSGAEKIHIANEKGEPAVNCNIITDLNEEEKGALDLRLSYQGSETCPITLGEKFLDFRKEFSITQQELAKKTGITPGTIHHYESLIKTLAPKLKINVKNKELTFKEARSIADIDDYDRQLQLAKPFLKGELSSVHVEKIVSLAKKHPTTEVKIIIESITKGRQIVEEKKPEPEKKIIENPIDFGSIDSRILKISAEIDLIQSEEIPEFKRLKLISSLRILQSRTQLALSSLNTQADKFNLLDSKLLKK